jgi:chemotaxis protein methyltransferase CheR
MPSCLKIYVIDDAMELCQELRGWLSDDGHEVTCSPARNVSTHALTAYQPDLIVLGMTRYAGSGMEIFKRIESHRHLKQVPIIVVSDDASLEYEMLDVFDFQARPFDRERMDVCLKRLSDSRKYLMQVSFAEPELTALKKFLLEHSGLHFNQHNQRILERGLMRRIQALRMESLPAYSSYLTATPDNYDEVNKLIGLLTVGETSFFRYRSHREALIRYVIPKLLEANKTQRKLRIWSAGCSTGEEPYSLAILLLEHFPELMGWDVQILATDINKRSLRLAREGVYGERSLRMVEDSLRERYFEKSDKHYLLSAQVRRMVRFDYLNLQTASFPAAADGSGEIDLLSCRNVLIYFELETIRQIVAKFSQALSPQGYLFLGHAETMQNVSDRFRRHHQNNAFFYQRKDPIGLEGAVAKASAKAKLPGKPALVNPAKIKRSPPPVGTKAEQHQPEKKARALACDPETLYREALSSFDREKFSESARLFEQLLEIEPTHPKGLVGKGLLLANQGQYADARLHCARAIKEDDLLPEAYLLRGLILDMEGFLERALVEYQKVLWLEPAFVMAHYFSAKAYDHLADKEKKRRSLRNTLRVLEQTADQTLIPFSGGLSRGVFLEIVRKELAVALSL